jgi:hypothetical protein
MTTITTRHRERRTSRGRPAGTLARAPHAGRRGRRRSRVAAVVVAGAVTVGATGAESTASAELEPATVAEPAISSRAPMARRGCLWLPHTRPRARRWATRVVRLTDLTCREARDVWRHHPGWRDEMPGNVARAGGAVRIANPALVERLNAANATQATQYCKVWTRQRYRAPIIPFGNHVLWTVNLEQTFGYDNASQVTWVGPVRVWTDATANGFRWHADGAPWGNDWWVPAWMRLQHHSERFQKMTSVAIPNIGDTHSVAHVWNWKQWNGDWSTSGDHTGRAGCRDDD